MERRNGNQAKNYAIELRDVRKSFKVGDEELPVLKGISAAVEPGEFVSIVGPSGNGKSTLLNMITGIDRPTLGEIFVDGQAVHTMSENELAKWRGQQVGVIFQFFQMLPSWYRTWHCPWSFWASTAAQKGATGPRIFWKRSGWLIRQGSCPVWYRAGSSSALPLLVPLPMTRPCWWQMSQPATWTRKRRSKFLRFSTVWLKNGAKRY
jgi:hypothetical protein